MAPDWDIDARPAWGVPVLYVRYAMLVAASAVVAIGLATMADVPSAGAWLGHELFWILAAMCLLGELLPIRLARRDSFDDVTVSAAFALATLLAFGLIPAMVMFATVSLLADLSVRCHPVKALFNAAQYLLTLGSTALVLEAAGRLPVGPDVAAALPAIITAGVVFFVVNHVLAGIGTAILSGRTIRADVLGDLPFHCWTGGFQLALAPVIIAAARVDVHVVPLLGLPVIAIWIGGRQAVLNSHHALHDVLTDLPNRSLFRHRLEDAAAERRPFAVMLVDLDDFKAVNDSLGHSLGDLLLCQVAQRLRAVAPKDALVARMGGDEFALLVPGAGAASATRLGYALVEAIERPIEVESFSLDVRASIGIALHPPDGSDAHSLLKHADIALYRAKETPDRVEQFMDGDGFAHLDRLALAADLRRGIERGELVLHYQPKVALDRDRPDGVEALVRWQHPFLGLIGPEGFIPLAEQSNLIKPLTHWVLEEALLQCRTWRDSGLELRVAVNLSPRSLLDHGLADEIRGLLETYELPADALQVEITEHKIVSDFDRARAVLSALRTAGVRVAIDDFGTGYSSLAQLQQLPADEVKIDKSFVIDMERNSNNAAIVRSTIGLGRNLALDVTAEGVETAEAHEQLLELGCDYVQGFLIGRPGPAEACERVLRGRRFSREAQAPAYPPVTPVAAAQVGAR